MEAVGTRVYLGNTEINATGLYFSDNLVAINPYIPPPPPPIPINGLEMWLDPTNYAGSGSLWLSYYGNGTGSFSGSYTYSGSNFFNYPQATKVNFTNASGDMNYSTIQNTIFVVGRASGSGAISTVGRLLTAKGNNWLLGTYSAGGNNYMRAYDPGGVAGFFDTPFDNDWRVYTGIWQNSTSASFYVNGAFVTTLTDPGYGGRVGPNTPCINDSGAEAGQGDLGDVIIYNKVLSDAEITEVYDAIKGKYGLT
jgi:hypothetical protein